MKQLNPYRHPPGKSQNMEQPLNQKAKARQANCKTWITN